MVEKPTWATGRKACGHPDQFLNMVTTLILQPWFSAVGHPAQSLLNTARVLDSRDKVAYAITLTTQSDVLGETISELRKYGDVETIKVHTPSIREGTFKMLLTLRLLLAKFPHVDRLFFLDAHLVIMALLWNLVNPPRIKHLKLMYLMGPERVGRSKFARYIVGRFLSRSEVTLYLRTEELAHSWREAYPEANLIDCLPSLELPEQDFFEPIGNSGEKLLFGVIGQVRIGKGLEWLVPLFKSHQNLGTLTIAGSFASPHDASVLNFLNDYDYFYNAFLSEQAMLELAAKQDYLLMLYDKWDYRMEGAVMFLAARVNRPVIVYNRGWCGRMVDIYGNGLTLPEDDVSMETFFRNLPSRSDNSYIALQAGVKRFYESHNCKYTKVVFSQKIAE